MTAIEIHRDLPADIGTVWRSWTDADLLASWFWPPKFGTMCSVDLRVGGRFRIDAPSARLSVLGEYVVVEEPTVLAFTWQWDGEGEETLVTLTFTPTDAGTRLELVHERFADEQARADHEQGWNDCLDRLPGFLG
ncbi:SRPBCC domain-containing protein [Humibacter sp. RRB41]|uniref:SRPBCC family protein n=1 Tax=Humibacter sp. RRB41 TaxID=2919946 RepID=UPI001FA9FD1B|nr:SRPBCC domain-containing protein [Humibacter sp. RRB41]